MSLNREHHVWHSPNLDRNMDLLVFGHAGARVLVFPTRCGRFFDYENWRMVQAHQHALEQGWYQLFCLDSVDEDSLYADWKEPRSRIEYHMQYMDYCIQEVLPFTRDKNPMPFV